MAHNITDNICKRKSQVSSIITVSSIIKFQISLQFWQKDIYEEQQLQNIEFWQIKKYYIVCKGLPWVAASFSWLHCSQKGALFARNQNCFLWGASNTVCEEMRQEWLYSLLWAGANSIALHVLKLLPNRCCLMVTGICSGRSADSWTWDNTVVSKERNKTWHIFKDSNFWVST